ncbi:hypothetical protein [Pseudoduganella sp. R-34]|uniref:hypothetical protein n=1 Tax=unclassified Pseudoduganella TaxID=2637179 RepID=UPI003CE9F826
MQHSHSGKRPLARTLLLAFATCLGATACAHHRYPVQTDYAGRAAASCMQYGYRTGTDEFADCVSMNVNAAKDRELKARLATDRNYRRKLERQFRRSEQPDLP